jgi:outer membrane protein assembly factor BamD (BamD/ComL family)
MELGFTTEQLSNAIKEWSKSATDTYEQGLAALYEQRYSDASRLILESINASPKGPIDRYVSLARAEYEQKHYDAARSALNVALAAHPDDPLLLQNLEAINRAQKAEGPNTR